MSKKHNEVKPALKEIIETKILAKNHTTDKKIKNKELAQEKEAESANQSDHHDNKGFKTTRVGSNRGK